MGVTGHSTKRHGIVLEAAHERITVALHDDNIVTVPATSAHLLPPAQRRAPGAGRPTTTATLRVGDVLAVRDVGPGGVTPMRTYTVAAVEDTPDGLRVELAGEDGSGMVVVR
jgi:hypothetical protein